MTTERRRFGQMQNVFVGAASDGRVYYQANYVREVVDMALSTWINNASLRALR